MMIVMKVSTYKQTPSSRKEITHARIVETAARAIRRSGYDGTGVADIMKEAGLTHGGFYAHFASREAMLAEAADRAREETIANAKRIFAEAPEGQGLQALMHAYLSDAHMANIETGCALVALGSEMPRQPPEVRNASTCQMKEMLALVEGQLSGRENARDEALVMLSTLVGTLMLARAAADPELSEAIRQATLKHYTAKV
jgi:TetR/AcrR family transcriptional repressor of nem operon